MHKDHFDISYVRFGGGPVGPDEGFGDVWDIRAGVVHSGGLEKSSWYLALYKDHFDISYVGWRPCGPMRALEMFL